MLISGAKGPNQFSRAPFGASQTYLPAGHTDFAGSDYRNSGFMGLPPEVNAMFGLVGATRELTFTAAGENPYCCVLHASGPDATEGMVGKVIVTE